MSKQSKDITQTGPVGLRGIRNQDLYNYLNSGAGNSAIVKQALSARPSTPFGPGKSDYDRYYAPTLEEDTSWKDLGNSSYDAPYMLGDDSSYIGEHRAQEQSGLMQLTNGILKGVGLAGTTFLDGTVGLIAGITEGVYNAANGGGWEGFGEGFFNNEVSKALREFNQEMERVLPNYRTKDEIENPWALRNIFSMNTFADDFLKNMGFTVGAFYSGNAFLGALKSVGLATRISKTAASTIGSVVSGFNEGRIEAGNLYDEMLTAELGNLQAARDQAKQDVLNSPEYQAMGQSLVDEYNQKKAAIDAMPDKMIPNGEGGFVSQKQQALLQLGNEYSGKLSQLEQQAVANIDRRYEEQVKDAQHRAAQAGIADMILNTLYLPAENMFAYGKLYGRKFKPKADLKKGVKEKAIDVAAREADLEETMGKRIAREGKEYVATPRSAKKAALKGLGVGISEGAEEINQSAMSSFASNLYQPDSPDAYYKALTNDDYHMETKDAMTAFSEAMVDSWGNPDTYKEGLVGFLTGLIGMPTFGRVNNADANTYLGRNKMIGLSGGILGELSNNRRLNAEAAGAVDAMNKVVQLAADTENFFVRMNSFYNAKSGFSEENDKFEFNNAADNELFHAIDAFRRSGRMQDLKDIISENFDDITPEQLADIAEKTTGEDNLWSDLDGNSMASTPDGQAKMKSILNDRKKEIMEGIDAYEKALDEVRSIANNSLDDDQTAELAWLKWKVDKFGKRFADIKDKNKDLFTDISNALLNYRDELQEGIDDSVEASEDNIAVQELNKTNNLIKFITALQGAPTPMALSAILEANPDFVKYFTRTDSQFAGYDSFNGMLGVSYDQYERAWNELRDCTRLAKAARDFDARYKEFTEDPMKLIKNRQQIDAQNAKQEESKKNLKGRNLLDSENVSDIVKAVDNGEMSLEDMQKLIDADTESDVKEQRQQMYDNAAAILKRAQELEDKLNAMAGEPGADQQAIEDAKRQLEKQKYLAQNAEQLTDTNTEVMNTLDMSDDDVQRALAAGQALEDAESARIDAAKEVLKTAEAQLEESQQVLDNMPTAMPKGLEDAVAAAEAAETGHDGPTAAPAVNEPQAQDSPTPINYYDIAYTDINAFVPAYSEPQKTGAATALAKIYAEIDSLHREGTLSKQSGIMLETKDSFKDAGRLIGDNNVRKLISDRINKVLANDAAQLAPSDPAPVTNQDPVTPDTSNTEAIERQIDAEANRSLDENGRQDSYSYWKRTTTQYFIHSARAAWEKTVDWIKRQGKSPQQVRRTEAVYQFLEDHHAWDNINAGAVEMKGRKGPTIKFVTSKSLNEKAGEFVVLMVDSQGRIVGDLGSKNDIGTHRQVGLVDFLDAAEKEYNEKKDKTSEDIVPLTGETTVLQNLVGRVDYAPKNQRRSLNEIWGGKKFIIALARKSGKNSGMRTNSLSLSATGGRDEIGDHTLSPLDAVAGQPYVLVESSDPARRYIPVPFSMPVFSPATANSTLGQAILKVLMTVSQEDFKTIRDPLRALLAVEDVRIGWGTKTDKNADRVTLTIQRNGKKEYYSAQRSDPNAGTVLFNKLAQAGIPFHVNRAFINGTYGPTGQSYNEMIGELAQTNLNSTHTVGDWFTVNPIGAKGTRMKSIGVNPEAEANQRAAEAVAARSAGRINVKYNGIEYTVDKDTWKAYNPNNVEITGAYALQVVALAQCQLNGYDTTQPGPYEIPLGLYNPVTGDLNRGTSKPKPKPQTPVQPSTSSQSSQPQQPSTPQAGQSDAQQPQQDVLTKMADILDDDVKQAVWDSLTDEQKQALASKSTKKIEQILDTIVEEAWDGTKVDNFESYLGARFRRGEINRTSRKWNEKKERAWLKQVLPQFSGHRLKVLRENLIQISGGENPTWAYGQFKNGIITLGKAAAKGTLYHEAFHAVTWCLFNEQERHEMFDAARAQYGIENPVALEEQLAEDFRRYVQLEELPVVGRLVRFFRTLRQFIRSLTGKENYIDKVFYSISRGAYVNREVQNTDITRLSKNVAELNEELLGLKEAYSKAQQLRNKVSAFNNRRLTEAQAKEFVTSNSPGYNVIYAFQSKNSAGWKVGIMSEAAFKERTNRLEKQRDTIYNSELSEDEKSSRLALEEQEARYRRVQPGVAAERSMQDAKRHGFGIINSKPMNITRLGSYLTDMFQKYKNAFGNNLTYRAEMKVLASLINYIRAHNAVNENGVLYKFVATADEEARGFQDGYAIAIEKKVPLVDEPIILLHEIIHSTTSAAISDPKTNAEKKFSAKLKALYQYVKEWNAEHHVIPEDEYGLTDFNEFIAELANPYFLKYLSRVEVDDRYRYKEENARRIGKSNPNRSNALVQFLEALKDFLNTTFGGKTNRAHAQLIAIYDEYLENSGPEKFDYIVRTAEGKKARREGITTYARTGIVRAKPVIEQYHRDRLEYGNLSEEQKDYIGMRGISIEEYNRMSEFEREVLFECMGI